MKTIYSIILSVIFTMACFAQSPTTIKQRCPSPNGSIYGKVQVASIGDININPCPGRSTVFTGNVVIPGAVTGTGTTNFIPRWTGLSSLGNTPFSWDGTTYTLNNTGLNGTFLATLKPSAVGAGTFTVGRTTGASAAYINIDESTATISNGLNDATGFWGVTDGVDFSASLSAGTNRFVIIDSGTNTSFVLDGTAQGITMQNGGGTVFELGADQNFKFTAGAIRMDSDCAGTVTLDSLGEFDLTTTSCYGWAGNSGTRMIIAIGVTATGIISTNNMRVASSIAAADSGNTVNYWIIARP